MTSLKNLSLTLVKGSFLKPLLLAGVLLSFVGCKDDLDGMYKSPCLITEEEKQKQNALDIELIEKHFEENNLDLTEYQVTDSGLHFKTLQEGTGDAIKDGDKVEVHYVGKNLAGATFDSSYDRAAPFTVIVGIKEPTNGIQPVIEGWYEALRLMQVGEEARIYVPSNLAYGRCGSQNGIPPNAVLVFDIKVLRKI